MAVPQRVPIARGAGYRSDTIGHYRHGQFYAAVRSAHRDDDQAPDRGRERDPQVRLSSAVRRRRKPPRV
jgi:hypothetical protein